jgi:hypothetical protein
VVAAVVGESQDTEVEGKSADHIESGGEAGKVDVVDLEERMKKELRAVMLLGEHEEVSWTLDVALWPTFGFGWRGLQGQLKAETASVLTFTV